jgi:hypothetical protein
VRVIVATRSWIRRACNSSSAVRRFTIAVACSTSTWLCFLAITGDYLPIGASPLGRLVDMDDATAVGKPPAGVVFEQLRLALGVAHQSHPAEGHEKAVVVIQVAEGLGL